MKLWIDDFREPPDSSWVWAKTLAEASVQYIYNFDNPTLEISFDHDLGVLISLDDPLPPEKTTMALAQMIEHMAAKGVKPPKWSVHSMNPVGKANLTATLESADRLYKSRTA